VVAGDIGRITVCRKPGGSHPGGVTEMCTVLRVVPWLLGRSDTFGSKDLSETTLPRSCKHRVGPQCHDCYLEYP
jgi:hypothetical protein